MVTCSAGCGKKGRVDCISKMCKPCCTLAGGCVVHANTPPPPGPAEVDSNPVVVNGVNPVASAVHGANLNPVVVPAANFNPVAVSGVNPYPSNNPAQPAPAPGVSSSNPIILGDSPAQSAPISVAETSLSQVMSALQALAKRVDNMTSPQLFSGFPPPFPSSSTTSSNPSQTAPASHLSAFPSPVGGVNASQLLNAARASSSEVSAHPQYSDSSVGLTNSPISSGGGNVTVSSNNHVHLPGGYSATSNPLLRTMFTGLPTILRPPCPSETDKEPRSMDALSTLLWDWVHQDASLSADHRLYQAAIKYVNQTLEFGRLASASHAFAYHKEAVQATTRVPPLWDPLTGGEIYTLAYIRHIVPHVGRTAKRFNPPATAKSGETAASSTSTGQSKKRSRPSPPAVIVPTEECWLHGVHTNADCNWQQHRTKKAKKDASSRSSSA
jgi:hypothetical protein